jgi:hypothetical protein
MSGKREKAAQWFKKQMMVHQSSEKARNAYKQIQQASMREYTIEKYGPVEPSVGTPTANFSDDATRSFSMLDGAGSIALVCYALLPFVASVCTPAQRRATPICALL